MGPNPISRYVVPLLLGLCTTLWFGMAGNSARAQTISTVAGGGVGDGVAATRAALHNPSVVLVQAGGALLIVDSGHHRIRRVDPAGVISTLVGPETRLNAPLDAWSDGQGTVWIADTGNHRVLRVDVSGEVVTVAGTGEAGYAGDGDVALRARLNRPSGVYVDSEGGIWIADTGNHRVRRVDPSGTIETVAGNGKAGFAGDGGPATEAGLSAPKDLVGDSDGSIWIADSGNGRLRRLDASGTIETLGQGAGLKSPARIFVAEAGFLVVDEEVHRVFRVDHFGVVTALFGPDVERILEDPSDVCVDAQGRLLVVDGGRDLVWRIEPSGRAEVIAGGGVGDGGTAMSALLTNPFDVVSDGLGNLWIVDTSNQRVRKVDASGLITTVAGTGRYGFSEGNGRATEAMFANPLGIAVDGAGHLYIADTFNQRVRKVDPFGGITTVAGQGIRGFSGDGGPATDAALGNPSGVFVDAAGSIWIADQDNHRIRKVDATGKMTTVAGNGHKGFGGDGGPATEAKLADPQGVFVDTDGVLWIADRSNHRIRRVDPSGIIETVVGNGVSGFSGDGGPATEAQLRIPSRVFKDMFGNLLIVDRGNNRIRRVDPSGVITTVTGNGVQGYAGDGDLAGNASLARPFGFYVHDNGMLTIADTENHRIRQVLPPQRTLQIEKNVVSIAADGQDGAIILARVTDLEGGEDPVSHVRFRIVDGEGVLSDRDVVASGGQAATRLRSQRPGQVTVQAHVEGAWGVTATVDVKPVRKLAIKLDNKLISANGFDRSTFEVQLLDLDGNPSQGDPESTVRFQMKEGEGRLTVLEAPFVNGKAHTVLTSQRSNRVIVQAWTAGAFPVEATVAVKRPLPWQLPDVFEPDNAIGEARGLLYESQSRSFHTPGDVDWMIFETLPDHAYSLQVAGDLDVQATIYSAEGKLLTVWGAVGEFQPGSSGTFLIALTDRLGRAGGYEIALVSRRVGVLALAPTLGQIAADGNDVTRVRVEIHREDGTLQAWDESSEVKFEVIEGEGVLSVPSVKVHQGVAEVDLKAISVGQIRIRATVEGLAPVFAEVTALPALALDLNPAVGDQEQRTLERLPAVGMEMAVDLVILSGGVDMNGFQAILEFDPEFLAFEGFRPADLMDGATPILSFPKAGQVEINVAILGGRVDRERGSLGQAVFRVVQTGDVETAIGFLSAQIGRVSGQERLRVQTEQARVVVGGRLVGIGDLNGDGSVNLGDLIVFARHFGTRQGESGFDARFDLDGNGEVGLDDFLIFAKGFGQAEGK